ncbi:MAG: 3-dehydroquinate synthase II [Clostridia bacterium]|nr:3-dehydroquinate synthase II [Clostridia bacterium]
MSKMICFDARSLKDEEIIMPKVYNLRYRCIMIGFDMLKRITPPGRMKIIVELNDEANLGDVPDTAIVFSKKTEILYKAKERGYKTAAFAKVSNYEGMDEAWKTGEKFDYLVVELVDETNIPLELLIARLQSKDTVLLKVVNNCQDAEIAFGVMESGSDGVVLRTDDLQEIMEVDKLMEKEEIGKIELVKAKVIDVQHIGMGYRACIDTTNLLGTNEGMIVGSTSNGGLLVSSETHFLPYMELRPFRVNAGAVHSYVWMPDGMTGYITELKAGSKVLCVDTEGNTREVSVGRVKIEMRPLLKIESEFNGIRINTIVQDDWHIRIFGGNGEVRNASTIKAGDEMMAYVCNGGRHVGIKIDERLEER